MTLTLIAAMARNRVIGRGGAIPWRLPADLARFKRITMGRWLIMGRRTFDSIGRPLPGRTTVVVTRRQEWSPAGVLVARSIDEAISLARDQDEVFVAGGAEIYAATLERAARIRITLVEGDYDGDAWFPVIDPAVWRLTSQESHPGEADRPAYRFLDYERIRDGARLDSPALSD